MFALSYANRFFLYPFPTDMRKSFYSLSGIVTSSMGMDVRNGYAFIFVNRYCNSMKILHMEVADLLRPLYYRLRELVLGTDYIQVDETTIPIVREERHKTVKGYIWLVRSVVTGRIFFHYDHGSRSQKTAMALLRDFQGTLQTGGYEVYAMYENKKGVLPLGCWAHARRKFTEAQKNDRERAEYALEQIGLLYEIERKADAEEMDYDQRADLRERLAYPILVAFEKWLVSFLNPYPRI